MAGKGRAALGISGVLFGSATRDPLPGRSTSASSGTVRVEPTREDGLEGARLSSSVRVAPQPAWCNLPGPAGVWAADPLSLPRSRHRLLPQLKLL